VTGEVRQSARRPADLGVNRFWAGHDADWLICSLAESALKSLSAREIVLDLLAGASTSSELGGRPGAGLGRFDVTSAGVGARAPEFAYVSGGKPLGKPDVPAWCLRHRVIGSVD
jgi:hypothetical protein